ncbi:MAG TPA: hypothetical protein VHO07_26305, partial [Streptosporangiaceae bacterium]|nr:hypothetical protein [Streptosporangiaceae bacterium]
GYRERRVTSCRPVARWRSRQRRVEVSISKMQSGKMQSGKRRPCCFNLAACTDPDLSKNGKLINPR